MLGKPSPAVYRAILGLRVVRHYQPVPLTDAQLAKILEAGRWTGSSKNTQPWTMVVVSDRSQLDRVAACGHFTTPVRNAVAAIVLVRHPRGGDFDIGRLAQNLMLGAAALGVGSCPVTLHNEAQARQVLGVPPDHGCRYAVTLGRVDQIAERLARRRSTWGGRKPLESVVRWEGFGE